MDKLPHIYTGKNITSGEIGSFFYEKHTYIFGGFKKAPFLYGISAVLIVYRLFWSFLLHFKINTVILTLCLPFILE